jgi:murein DD-endopeptidase MepM/ murein hydrolase activator NlpD
MRMHSLATAVVLLCCPGLAHVHARDVRLDSVQVQAFPAPRHAPLDPTLALELVQTARELLVHRLASEPSAEQPDGLAWPLALQPGIAGSLRNGISNFMDLDPAFPGQLRDYACGTRTYDTVDGHNHRGIDVFPWPFPWQTMAQGGVEVRAVAGGTVTARHDGQFDRNCSGADAPGPANLLAVLHDDNTIGVYVHLKSGSEASPEVGSRIERGDYIGHVGSSGLSTGPHLHFELLDVLTHRHIEPHAGECNAGPSRWAEQAPYRNPRLNLLGVHARLPEYFPGECGRTEVPHYARRFLPHANVHILGYFTDLMAGGAVTLVVRSPDGQESLRTEYVLTRADLGDKDALSAATLRVGTTLPADAAPGVWHAEMSYHGGTLTQSFAVGGPIIEASGLWYQPSQSGHGFTLETVELDGRLNLVAVWFTYLDGKPRWVFGLGPIVDEVARIDALISEGAMFPPAFDPAAVQPQSWGTLEFRFDTVDRGEVRWDSDLPGFGSGALELVRLAGAADINRDSHDTGMRACASGSWYDPAASGHGVLLQVIDLAGARSMTVTWYAYHEGEQVWLTGVGPIDGNRATVPLALTSGGQFPPAFDANAIERRDWGTASFELLDPQRMQMRWSSSIQGYGEGELVLQRLTSPFTSPCL